MRLSAVSVVALIAMLTPAAAAQLRVTVVEVDAGAHDRRHTPVIFALPPSFEQMRAVVLERADNHQPVEVQILRQPGEQAALVWVLSELKAGATCRYLLKASEPPKGDPTVACIDDGKDLLLRVGERPVLRYHEAMVESPAGLDAVYRRSGQIHPLYTPSGRVVTDDFPPDHAHQHGLFFAWVNTTFHGQPADFWNQKSRTGSVRHDSVVSTTGGPVFAQFQVRLAHDTGPRGAPALREGWTVRTYNLTDRFLVDFESRQSCAGAEPLEINKYHYGGMGLRGHRDWFDPQARGEAAPDPARSGRSDFLTSDGKHRADGNHTRPRWVDLSGLVDGQFAGVAILDHPGNYRFPQHVRLHPNKPYFCFAPMVEGSFKIEPGAVYLSRYRLVLHDGPPDKMEIERAWQDYAEPPRVRVVAAR